MRSSGGAAASAGPTEPATRAAAPTVTIAAFAPVGASRCRRYVEIVMALTSRPGRTARPPARRGPVPGEAVDDRSLHLSAPSPAVLAAGDGDLLGVVFARGTGHQRARTSSSAICWCGASGPPGDPGRLMHSTTAAPARAAPAPRRKHRWNISTAGICSPPPSSVTRLVRTSAMTAPATVVPIERISALTPTPAPASEAGEFSRINVGIAAYPIPTPAEATQVDRRSCQGESAKNAARRDPAAITTAPDARVARPPSVVSIRPEIGVNTSIISPAGAIHRPAWSMDWPSPYPVDPGSWRSCGTTID